MSKIMVLPGTKWQIPLVQRAKSMGHEVLLVNPTKNSGVYELADDFLASDIFDIDSIEQYAKEKRVDAIITDECDIAVPVVAELGKRLGLSALSVDAAALYTNKALMLDHCKEIGIRTVEHRMCETEDDAVDFQKRLGKPIIIKPLDSNASHGVFKVEKEHDIREHYLEALSYSRTRKAVLAERYISGIEFTVDGVKTPEYHYTLAISEKKHYKHNENIANELLFTHNNENYDYEKLKKINDLFVMSSPLEFGLTHAEYKYEDGEFYLIEIAARGGGNLISSVIAKYMSGYDTYEYLINCALGKVSSPNFEIPEAYAGRASVLKFFNTPQGSGKVKDILGIECLENEKDVVDYSINFKTGDRIEDAKNDSDRIGYYIACSESKEKLQKVMDRIEENFKIIVE